MRQQGQHRQQRHPFVDNQVNQLEKPHDDEGQRDRDKADSHRSRDLACDVAIENSRSRQAQDSGKASQKPCTSVFLESAHRKQLRPPLLETGNSRSARSLFSTAGYARYGCECGRAIARRFAELYFDETSPLGSPSQIFHPRKAVAPSCHRAAQAPCVVVAQARSRRSHCPRCTGNAAVNPCHLSRDVPASAGLRASFRSIRQTSGCVDNSQSRRTIAGCCVAVLWN